MPLLEVKELTTKVSGYTILNKLDFTVEENELRVLLGPNGAGKTTLIAMITGQFKPTVGHHSLRRQRHHRQGAGRDFPAPASAASSRSRTCTRRFRSTTTSWSRLQGDRKVFKYLFKRVTPEENDRIWDILEFVELADRANDPADTLSHGERQWLEIGNAHRLASRSFCCSTSRPPA